MRLKFLALFALLGCSDRSAPTWPSEAKPTIERSGTSVTLAWPRASDDRAVTAYRLRKTEVMPNRGGSSVFEKGQWIDLKTETLDVAGPASSHRYENVPSTLSFRFEVRALDAARNVSLPTSEFLFSEQNDVGTVKPASGTGGAASAGDAY